MFDYLKIPSIPYRDLQSEEIVDAGMSPQVTRRGLKLYGFMFYLLFLIIISYTHIKPKTRKQSKKEILVVKNLESIVLYNTRIFSLDAKTQQM